MKFSPKLVEAVKSGRLPESRLDDAITRTLNVKYEYGLFDGGGIRDEACASEGINDPEVIKIEKEAAEKSVHLMRDNDSLLPLNPDEKILLVEQIAPIHLLANNYECHPGLLWKNCFKYSSNIGMVETEMAFTEDDRRRVLARLDEVDTIVVTNITIDVTVMDATLLKSCIKLARKW